MTIHIEIEADLPFDFDCQKLAETVIAYTIEREQFPYEAEISLLLTDNVGICEINHSQRQIDKPTDVLSFPLLQYPSAGVFDEIGENDSDFNPDTGEILLGDIVINVERVIEQARAYGHDVEREYAFLIVHSMLHLFGYDHVEPADAAQMEPLQKQILEELKIKR